MKSLQILNNLPYAFPLIITFLLAGMEQEASPLYKQAHVPVDQRVTNAGSMRAEEIVQMYVRDEIASVTRPVKELRGFARNHLEPGEKKTVTLLIDVESLAFYDKTMQRRVEPGVFQIMIGASSDHLSSVALSVR